MILLYRRHKVQWGNCAFGLLHFGEQSAAVIPRDQCVIGADSGGEKGLCIIVGLVRRSYLAIRISCFVARETRV